MPLAEIIDLCKRRAYDKLPNDVECKYIRMRFGEPTFIVVLSDNTETDTCQLSEVLARTFADTKVNVRVLKKGFYVRDLNDYQF